MKNIICIPLLSLMLFAATRQTSVAAPELNLDLQTLIAGIKHFDTSVTSGKGEFVYEHHLGGKDKRIYAFTFEGTTFEAAQLRVDYHNDSFGILLAEIWDSDRLWEISEAKERLFDVDISLTDYELLNKPTPELPQSVKQQLDAHDLDIFDDFRIENDEESSYSQLINNVTGDSYYIDYTEEYFSVYNTYLDYEVRGTSTIHAHLDPRYWMTFGKATPSSYLMIPLWKVLETHESEILQTEMHNGEEIYLISVQHPTAKSLKLWVSPEKGFRLIKLQSIFVSRNEPPWSSFKNGVHYLKERVLHYREYQPGLWFPEKVEETIHPLFTADPGKKGDRLAKTTLQVVNYELNTDVAGQFQLDVPEDTLIFDYGLAKKRPFRELKETSQ